MESFEIGGNWLKELNLDMEGSDRSCAILSAAILNDKITILLKNYLLQPDSKSDELFDHFRPLEPFSPKINLSFRLGLISLETKKALNWMRDIRNDAAHITDFTFTSDRVMNLTSNILKILDISNKAPDLLTSPYDSLKGHYVVATVFLVTTLQVEATNINHTSTTPQVDMGASTWTDAGK